jgi:hypothetical protein
MTTARGLLARLAAAGVAARADGPELVLDGPEEALTDGLIAEARRLKPGLLKLLAATATVTISGKTFCYLKRWSGERFDPPEGYISFDSETELISEDPAAPPPRIALASASAGPEQSCLIHPDDLGAFVLAHRRLRWCGHNVASFDFWAVARHLKQRKEEKALAAWWRIAEEGRLCDSMLLDVLVRLARDDSFPEMRNLACVAREYAGLEVDKADPYRLRYGEVIDKDWAEVEPGFFEYAVKDSIVTLPAYLALREEALRLQRPFPGGEVLPDAEERFGPLSEAVQVKKAIALARIRRRGVGLDLEEASAGEARLRARLDAATKALRSLCPGLYKSDKKGAPVLSARTGAPSRSVKALDAQLLKVREEIFAGEGVLVSVPLTKKAKLPSRSAKFWSEYAELHPFLSAWVEAEEAAKLLQFCSQLRQGRVHPRYSVMVRSGRTSASSPNIQQVPRSGGFRAMFVPSPGHFLLAVDYSCVELRTLAAVCLRRYGKSKLAEVIKAGLDPHAHTAAMMLNLPLEEFLRWKDDPDRKGRYADGRQAAKAINFGTPGGLGAASLARYAKANYGIALTADQAREMRQRLITEVYPELEVFLAEDAHAVLARNLGCTAEAVKAELGDTHLSSVYKVLAGNPLKADGKPYQEGFVRKVWVAVARLCADPGVSDLLLGAVGDAGPAGRLNERGGLGLANRVCQAGVATLTGRIRGRVRYSAARNSPFQGLAADGAALALLALVREGFRVAAFVHDEVLVELPDEGGYVPLETVRRIEQIMVREMEKVTPGVPAAVESALSWRWDKKAKLIVRGDEVYPWEPEG